MISFEELKRNDVVKLNEIRNLCVDYLHNSKKFNLLETYDWFDKNRPNYYSIKKDNVMIGYFRVSNHSKENSNLYIGADLHPDFWGKGIGYECYKKMLPFLFENFNLNKITLEVLSNNDRAIKLYNKLGFKTEGVKREEVFKKNEFIDSIIMSILKKELIYDNK